MTAAPASSLASSSWVVSSFTLARKDSISRRDAASEVSRIALAAFMAVICLLASARRVRNSSSSCTSDCCTCCTFSLFMRLFTSKSYCSFSAMAAASCLSRSRIRSLNVRFCRSALARIAFRSSVVFPLSFTCTRSESISSVMRRCSLSRSLHASLRAESFIRSM